MSLLKYMIKILILIVSLCLFAGCEKSPTSIKGDAKGEKGQDTDTGPLSPGDFSTSDSLSNGGPIEQDTCANLDLTLEHQPVTIMLVVDRSASMDLQLGDNDTRWSILIQSLMGTSVNPESGLVWQLHNHVSFGLVSFTAMRNSPETCPMLDIVPPQLSSGHEISKFLRADDFSYKGASPVPEAIYAAINIMNEMGIEGKKVIILATDGMPQTCDTLAQQNDSHGEAGTIAAVQAAFESGISTFVVGIGDKPEDDHLQKVANAGVGFNVNTSTPATFYRGATESSLIESVSTVLVEESRSCIYQLSGKAVAQGEEVHGIVIINGQNLSLNDETNGWRMKSGSEIEILGKACDEIQVGTHQIEAFFPCESIIIIL